MADGASRPAGRAGGWTIGGAILAAFLGTVVARPAFADAPRGGTLLLKSAADALPLAAINVETRYEATVTANVARVRLVQRFANPGEDWVEGLYVFPLPGAAAVDELEMRIGERRIRGEIRSRETARAEYEKARETGRRAGLVDQERPNLFTTTVANVAPREELTIEIAWLEALPWRDGRYSLRLPLAVTPRYTPGLALDAASPQAAETARVANALTGLTPTPERVANAGQSVAIQVRLRPGFPLGRLESPHHAIDVVEDGDGSLVRLAGGRPPADRDFELAWTPDAVPHSTVAVFTETRGADHFALLLVTPPAFTQGGARPRELTFVIDTSGSMEGPSLVQARAALAAGIRRLGAGERFNVIRFSDEARALFPAPVPADELHRATALAFVESLEASGGTNIRAAVELALALPGDDQRLRQVVFATDGSVANEAELVALVHARAGQTRWFTIGIGAAPNAWFLRELAAAGRGSHVLIADLAQVRERVDQLLLKLERPALVGLELHWPPELSADLAAPLPRDVYAGDPLVVLARLSGPPAGLLGLSGSAADGAWLRQEVLGPPTAGGGIAKLWARERIGEWSRRKQLGLGEADELDARIERLALEHHLVSERTSLVAVESTPVRAVGEALMSAQAPTPAPAGSYWSRTTGFAATATTAPLATRVSLLALALALWLALPLRRGA